LAFQESAQEVLLEHRPLLRALTHLLDHRHGGRDVQRAAVRIIQNLTVSLPGEGASLSVAAPGLLPALLRLAGDLGAPAIVRESAAWSIKVSTPKGTIRFYLPLFPVSMRLPREPCISRSPEVFRCGTSQALSVEETQRRDLVDLHGVKVSSPHHPLPQTFLHILALTPPPSSSIISCESPVLLLTCSFTLFYSGYLRSSLGPSQQPRRPPGRSSHTQEPRDRPRARSGHSG